MSANPDDASGPAGQVFAEAVAIMVRLRGPGGCPWDREQSFDSIRKYTLEETYEVLDAIERRNWSDLKEELGDLLLQVLFYAEMAVEPGYFTIAEVIDGLNRKLIRRHPHVFGDEASIAAGNSVPPGMETAGIDAHQVLRNWEQIKRAEKTLDPAVPASLLDSVPGTFPALMEAAKLGSIAAKVGFDWPDAEGVFDKLQEEISELREAIAQKERPASARGDCASEGPSSRRARRPPLYRCESCTRRLRVDPELALRQSNQKFRRRFAVMEQSTGLPLDQQSPDQLEALWSAAKLAENAALPNAPRAGETV